MLFLTTIKSLYLTNNQYYLARGLLSNPHITPFQKASIQNIFYISHEKWAVKKAKEFKHRYNCRNISTKDFVLSSKLGLLKSSKKYNGRSQFTKFAEIYVKSELINTLKIQNKILVDQYDLLDTAQSSDTAQSIEKSQQVANNQFYESAWQYIDTFDAFTKRVIHLKYDYDFNVRCSNQKIATMMCCSEETVRKSVARFSVGIRQEILAKYANV